MAVMYRVVVNCWDYDYEDQELEIVACEVPLAETTSYAWKGGVHISWRDCLWWPTPAAAKKFYARQCRRLAYVASQLQYGGTVCVQDDGTEWKDYNDPTEPTDVDTIGSARW